MKPRLSAVIGVRDTVNKSRSSSSTLPTFKDATTLPLLAAWVVAAAPLIPTFFVPIFQLPSDLMNLATLLSIVLQLSVLVVAILKYGDFLNPITMIIAASFLRFTLPLFQIMSDSVPLPLFELIGLNNLNAQRAHMVPVFFLFGLCTVFVFESIFRGRVLDSPEKRVGWGEVNYQNSQLVAVGAFLVGLFGLLVFLMMNFGTPFALITGEVRQFRDTLHGSGPFFYLGNLTIAGSTVFVYNCIKWRKPLWFSLTLPILGTLIWSGLGGRTHAFVHLVVAGIIYWHMSRNRRLKVRDGVVFSAGLLATIFYWAFVSEFRSGMNVTAALGVLWSGGFDDYLRNGLYLEVQQLVSPYGAILMGSGSVGGASFFHLLWPLDEFFDLGDFSIGGSFVAAFGLLNDVKWAFHGTLPAEAYVNFGPIGTAIVGAIVGKLGETIYRRFRSGRIHVCSFAILYVYLFRIVFESIEKYSEGLTVFCFTLFALYTARRFDWLGTNSARSSLNGRPLLKYNQTADVE